MPRATASMSLDLQMINPTAELEKQVLPRLGRQVRNLEIVVQDGRIVLRGITRSYYAKQLVQEAVMKATSLPIYKNAITVCADDPPQCLPEDQGSQLHFPR